MEKFGTIERVDFRRTGYTPPDNWSIDDDIASLASACADAIRPLLYTGGGGRKSRKDLMLKPNDAEALARQVERLVHKFIDAHDFNW
jgi:thiamine pyrophosphate-dependent acetolactate synthase large subunit-like protein